MDMADLRNERGMMTRIAKGLGLTLAAVSLWKKIPSERVVEIESITGIPREQLRPDLYRDDTTSADAA